MIEKQEDFNGQIKAIFRGGKINKIKWGADDSLTGWNTWDDKHKLEYSMELASAMNQAASIIQDERNELMTRIVRLEQSLANCEQGLTIQKTIVLNTITNSNAEKEVQAQRILELEKEVRELKD